MNKKFLKSVAALFAVAVLGVSCNSKQEPEIQYVDKPIKTTVIKEGVEGYLRNLGEVESTLKAKFSDAEFNTTDKTFSSTGTAAAAKRSDTLTALKAQLTELAKVKGYSVILDMTANDISGLTFNSETGTAADKNPAKAIIKIKAADGFELPAGWDTITIVITPTTANWTAE